MSNREEFEKWWRETKGTDIPYTGLASFTEDVMFSAWQARGELDAMRIEELQTDRDEWKDSTITANRRFEIAEDKVAELKSKNKELEADLDDRKREINLRCGQIQERDIRIAELTAKLDKARDGDCCTEGCIKCDAREVLKELDK